MSTTEPIRNKTDLQKFMNYYAAIQPNPRNQALILLGLYTALRIGDILQLKWRMVYDFNKHHFFDHIYVNEQKTQKLNVIALNQHAILSRRIIFLPNGLHRSVQSTVRRHSELCRKLLNVLHIPIISAVIPCAKPLATTHGSKAHSLLCSWIFIIIHLIQLPNVISELIRTKKTKFLQILTLEYNAAQKIKKISKRTKVFFLLSDLIYMNATLSYKMLHFYYSLFIFYSFYQILFTPHADSYSYILHKFPC